MGRKHCFVNILIKKGLIMKWVKQSVGYWCEEIKENKAAGEGICAAVLDTGISRHPDFGDRITAFRDFTGKGASCYDDSGHGTHVGGILAGDGRLSGGAYAGMAPKTSLLIAKVLDHEGNGNVENVIKGIDWILKERKAYQLRIVNISVGTQPELEKCQKRQLLEAVEELWDQGLVVVVSAGNYGPAEGTVAVPGNSPKVITVGVPDSTSAAGRAKRSSINYSGRGPTVRCVIKPDVFAPGTGIISCNARYGMAGEPAYVMKTGTSMATPVVSGAIACLLSKYPDMTNVEVKLKLRESCIKSPGTEAGWGMLNVAGLLRA